MGRKPQVEAEATTGEAEVKMVEVTLDDGTKFSIPADSSVIGKLQQIEAAHQEKQYKEQTDEFITAVMDSMQSELPEDLLDYVGGKVLVLPMDAAAAEAIGGKPKLVDHRLITFKQRIVGPRKKKGVPTDGEEGSDE
jgi:hypothetical protein|tara:strand:- start:13481 stop:13891 length:411 start_codon:yes stop_codon:yes gene_type:complete